MSLPPYKHTRNPALERENEFLEYKSWEAPLITYDGIVEKRKTTDLKLIRNQPRHPGIELEYLSPFSVQKSLQPSTKNLRKNGTKTGRSDSREEPIKNKSTRRDNEIETKIVSDESMKPRNGELEDDAKSTRSQRSTKTRESASRESLISRSSAKSSSTVEKILDGQSGSLKSPKNSKSRGFASKSRYSANGLDEDDQFRR